MESTEVYCPLCSSVFFLAALKKKFASSTALPPPFSLSLSSSLHEQLISITSFLCRQTYSFISLRTPWHLWRVNFRLTSCQTISSMKKSVYSSSAEYCCSHAPPPPQLFQWGWKPWMLSGHSLPRLTLELMIALAVGGGDVMLFCPLPQLHRARFHSVAMFTPLGWKWLPSLRSRWRLFVLFDLGTKWQMISGCWY